MTSSERPSPEPLLKKEASPAVPRGQNSGNALEASNALNYRALGSRPGELQESSESLSKVFPESFQNFLREVPAILLVYGHLLPMALAARAPADVPSSVLECSS